MPPPVGGSVLDACQPPFSPGHILGTDPNGNDILSRILYGGRASLRSRLAVNQLIGIAVGGTWAASPATGGGVVDTRRSCGCSTC